jgi:anti-anti-sigma factor
MAKAVQYILNIIMKNISKAHINVTVLSEAATIYLGGRFTFLDQSIFESECKKLTKDEQVKQITVNLEKVEFIDSSALGMLLVLRDHALSIGASLLISSPSGVVLEALNKAHFGRLFTIQEK